VLTRNKDFQAPGCVVCSSLGEAIEAARAAGETECFIIGGAAVYREAMPLVNKLYLTKVLAHVDGDVFFPEWGAGFQKISEESFPSDEKNDFPTAFEVWVR
jgi:dihydrofolate reductase